MTTHATSATGVSLQATDPQLSTPEQLTPGQSTPDQLTPEQLTPELLGPWAWHKQGLDGSLQGAEAADVFTRAGWARSVGGANPYLTLFARAGTRRADADADVLSLKIHELPTARGCTYVLG